VQVTVILRNMFHPDEFLENPFYKEELEADIRSECGKLGKVDKVCDGRCREQGREQGKGGGGLRCSGPVEAGGMHVQPVRQAGQAGLR